MSPTEPSDEFSATWPTSGMTRAGVAYELPMSAPPMGDSGCSLLPTPDASADKYRLGGDSQQSHSLAAMAIRGELT